jgi:hypothetical protein
MKARYAGAAAVALGGGYTAVMVGARRWHQHWGATDEEIARPLPGDDLIPAAKFHSTHAVTVHAPAERIWPWLAQMGYGDRAGTYSYDLFERRTGRNLYRVDPSIPPLAAGSTMPFYPGAPMTAAVAEPPHALVLWQVTSEGKAIDPAGPLGRRLRGLELDVRARAGGCGDDPAAGADAGRLPAGGEVGALHVAAGGTGPLRDGPPPAPWSPRARRSQQPRNLSIKASPA